VIGKNIFEYQDYKTYLSDELRKRKRGEQGRLAVALNCHTGYVSQVLNGSAHLSLEQGVEVNHFFNHSKNVSRYFLLLLQYARAGTVALRNEIKDQMKEILDQQLILKKRFQLDEKISPEDESILYSSWHYVAVHMAVLIPNLRTVPAIAEYLGISTGRVREVLETLLRTGLVQEVKGELRIGQQRVHLGHDSPLIFKHHTNWRLQALASLDRHRLSDLHYSSVVTIGEKDVPKVREILVRAIEEVRQTIRPSKDDALYCYCLDWFSVGKRD